MTTFIDLRLVGRVLFLVGVVSFSACSGSDPFSVVPDEAVSTELQETWNLTATVTELSEGCTDLGLAVGQTNTRDITVSSSGCTNDYVEGMQEYYASTGTTAAVSTAMLLQSSVSASENIGETSDADSDVSAIIDGECQAGGDVVVVTYSTNLDQDGCTFTYSESQTLSLDESGEQLSGEFEASMSYSGCTDDDGVSYSGNCSMSGTVEGETTSTMSSGTIDDETETDTDENTETYTDYTDIDNDGFESGVDCDDANADSNPDATEIANDGIDQDCDGSDMTVSVDADSDGHLSDDDCDDADASVYPGATEIADDGVDQDCDGTDLVSDPVIDVDGDTYSTDDGDCDDAEPTIHPGAVELANGFDDDCDGHKDEGFISITLDDIGPTVITEGNAIDVTYTVVNNSGLEDLIVEIRIHDNPIGSIKGPVSPVERTSKLALLPDFSASEIGFAGGIFAKSNFCTAANPCTTLSTQEKTIAPGGSLTDTVSVNPSNVAGKYYLVVRVLTNDDTLVYSRDVEIVDIATFE